MRRLLNKSNKNYDENLSTFSSTNKKRGKCLGEIREYTLCQNPRFGEDWRKLSDYVLSESKQLWEYQMWSVY